MHKGSVHLRISDIKLEIDYTVVQVLNHKQMVQDGCFDCYYDSVIDTLKTVYGDDFKEDVYFTKDGSYRWKNDECYCWTVYKHKVALTIETMEKKGLLK